jgi:hypothetical protein
MTDDDDPLCWMVLAPTPADELTRMAAAEWKRRQPYADEGPPWWAVPGDGEYAALLCRLPGAEGTERPFAERASRQAKDKPVYALWLDPERSEIVEWRNGREAGNPRDDPFVFAEALGVRVEP